MSGLDADIVCRIFDETARLLTSDPVFTSGMIALGFNSRAPIVPPVLESNHPLVQLGSDKLPAWVMEIGDAEEAALTDGGVARPIGLRYQGFEMDILLALVWTQQDRKKAFRQRLRLPPLLADLFLRHPGVGDAVDARVVSMKPDRAANHPIHVWQGIVRVAYMIQRSS